MTELLRSAVVIGSASILRCAFPSIATSRSSRRNSIKAASLRCSWWPAPPSPPICAREPSQGAPTRTVTCRSSSGTCGTVGLLAAIVVLSTALFPAASSPSSPIPEDTSASGDTLSNVPQTLSQDDGRPARIQRPKSRKAESCVVKCVTTCIRGGAGSPGEGPLNARRPLVVFKPGFRSRQYCLIECSDICNLIKDGEDGP